MAVIFINNATSAFHVHEPAERVLKLVGWEDGRIKSPDDVYLTFVGRGGVDINLKPTAVIAVADED
jgi:hypothetical protein